MKISELVEGRKGKVVGNGVVGSEEHVAAIGGETRVSRAKFGMKKRYI